MRCAGAVATLSGMRYRAIVGLCVWLVVGLSGCITIERHYDRWPDQPDATVGAWVDAGQPANEPNDDDASEGASVPDAGAPVESEPVDASRPPPSTKDNAFVDSRICTGEVDGVALTLKITGATDHVITQCTVDDGDVSRMEVYRLTTWDSHRLRCDVAGWVFATSDWYAYVVIPDSDGKQAPLDCGPEPPTL